MTVCYRRLCASACMALANKYMYIYIYIYNIYIYIYIRRPLVGHQAVKHGFEVYNSIASIDRLQTSKYIALLTSMFTASFSAFSLPATCFYVVIGPLDIHFTTPRVYPLRLGSPRESLKIPSIFQFVSSICASKMTLKTDPKSP